MVLSVSVALLLCLGSLASAVPHRIVGGEETTIEQYPSVVQVDFMGVFSGSWSHSCAGSVLTSRWFLSAAHCFVGTLYAPQYRRIRAGATFRNTGGVIHNVLREHNHPSYGSLDNDGDISVVELETAMVYTPVVQPVTIVAPGFVAPAGLPVSHAGWGSTTSDGGSISNVLREVTIFTVNQAICAQRYSEAEPSVAVTDNMICAGDSDRGACQSGGPLYYQGILVGVVSWGRGCADGFFPGVSTAVAPYTNWIIQVVEG